MATKAQPSWFSVHAGQRGLGSSMLERPLERPDAQTGNDACAREAKQGVLGLLVAARRSSRTSAFDAEADVRDGIAEGPLRPLLRKQQLGHHARHFVVVARGR